jgi:hypothetical protein
MDEPSTFEQLIAPDEMTLRFTPFGLATGGTIMSPEGKLENLRNTIANAELVSDVPDEVRQHCARIRKLFLYGVVEYDFFTLVEDLLHLQLEAAFRHRFISYYEGRIPIFVEDKVRSNAPRLLGRRRPHRRKTQVQAQPRSAASAVSAFVDRVLPMGTYKPAAGGSALPTALRWPSRIA